MSKQNAEFEIVVYGATSFTGKLVAEYLLAAYPGDQLRWAMAGRNADKLASVRDELGAPADIPLIVADAADPAAVRAMLDRTRCIVTTVGPYQLYGSELFAACAETGTDYTDLSGEPGWMHGMIQKHSQTAARAGGRLVFSCGFDSVPFDLGVQYVQELCVEKFGSAASQVSCRVLSMAGGFSGGTAASLKATMAAVGTNPELIGVLTDPFSLATATGEHAAGPQQPDDSKPFEDTAFGQWVAPFIMAPINTKNVHRSNALLGYPFGKDFLYDEMMATGAGEDGKKAAEFVASVNPLAGDDLQPGDGPSREEREAGNYDLLFIARHDNGEVRARVGANQDPGYNATARMLSESALCLTRDCTDLAGGIYTPAASIGAALRRRLLADKDGTFTFAPAD